MYDPLSPTIDSTPGKIESMYAQQMALRQQCRHPSGEVAEITHAEMEQTVVARFARMVAAYPDKPAIADLSQTLTYAELDLASNRIARALNSVAVKSTNQWPS